MAERNHSMRMQRCADQSSTELTMTSEPIKLTLPRCKTPVSPRSSYLINLLATMAKDIQNKEVNADSILEDHLSRIWQDSDGSVKSDSLHSNPVPNHPINWPKSIKESVTNFRPFFDNRFNSNQYYRQPSYRRCVYPIKKPLGTNHEQHESAPFNVSMRTPQFDNTEVIRCSWCDSDEEWTPSRDDIFQVIPGIPKKHSNIFHPTSSDHSSLTSSASLDRVSINPVLSYHSSFQHNSRFKQRQSFPSTEPIHETPASKPSLGLENLFLNQNVRDFKSATIDQSGTMKSKGYENNDESFTVVGYYLDEDPIPYRTILPCRNPTLGQFKRHLNKKGHLKFFFKKASNEFDSGVVHEEINNDEDLLPKWQGKVIGKVEVKH